MEREQRIKDLAEKIKAHRGNKAEKQVSDGERCNAQEISCSEAPQALYRLAPPIKRGFAILSRLKQRTAEVFET